MEFSAAIESAGPDATKHVRRHVAALEGQVTKLKVRLHDKGYDAVFEEAPVSLDRTEAPAASKPPSPSEPM
jgi:hypothetical protein